LGKERGKEAYERGKGGPKFDPVKVGCPTLVRWLIGLSGYGYWFPIRPIYEGT